MCNYISKKYLSEKKQTFLVWVRNVQRSLKEKGYHFSYRPTGSGKRNMVVKLCNKNYYDLDYQIIIEKIPRNYDWNANAKHIKDDFRKEFDNNRPKGFSCCEDSTQALQTKNDNKHFGYDIIITKYDNKNFYILYNKKNRNDANNKDYSWMQRKKMNKYRENFKKIKGAEMWNYLRKIYLNKRHINKDNNNSNRKKAYQIFNEAVNETLHHFKKYI